MIQPILYLKPGCPWCTEALDFFQQQGLAPVRRDVTRDPEAMRQMLEISGQTKTPTFVFGDFVVADFDLDEFQDALQQNPDIAVQLGLGTSDDR